MESKFHRWWLGSCVAALLLASWVGGFSLAVTSVFIVIYLTGVTLIGPDDEPLDVLSGAAVDVVAAEPGWLADEGIEAPVDAEQNAIEAAADVPEAAAVVIAAGAEDQESPADVVAAVLDDHDEVADEDLADLADEDVAAPTVDDHEAAASTVDDEHDAVPYPDDDVEPVTAVEESTPVDEHSPA